MRVRIPGTVRRVWRRPGFALLAMAVLGTGTGIAIATFRALDRMLLAPPPGLTDAASLGTLEIVPADGSTPVPVFSYLQVREIAKLAPTILSAAFLYPDTVTLHPLHAAVADSVTARAGFVAPAYFRTAGVSFERGRAFRPDEWGIEDGGHEVVLSDALWRRLGGADSVPLGATFRVRGRVFNLVGVTTPGFAGADRRPADLWLPVGAAWLDGTAAAPHGIRDGYPFRILVREPPEKQVAAWRYQLGQVLFWPVNPATTAPGASHDAIRIIPVTTPAWANDGMHLPLAMLLTGVCGAILLIATAEVGILLLARAARQADTVRLQRALGATRTNLLAQHISESGQVVLAGLAVGFVGSHFLADIAYRLLGRTGAMPVQPSEWRSGAITCAVLATAGVGAMILPVVYTWRCTNGEAGVARHGRQSGNAPRWQFGLIALQVALSLALLVGAGLFGKSFRATLSSRIGISLPGLLFAPLPSKASPQTPLPLQSAAAVAASLRGVPGVEAVALGSTLPFSQFSMIVVDLPRRAFGNRRTLTGPYVTAVTPGYFDAVGATLLEGRRFAPSDAAGAPLVTIVDLTLARTVWPDEGALGQCLRLGPPPFRCFTVIGVIADPPGLGLRRPVKMQYFVPASQRPDLARDGMFAFIRIAGDADAGIRHVRARLVQAGLGGPHPVVRTLRSLTARDTAPLQAAWTILGVIGLFGLLLAGTGVYAVSSYFVRVRAREIGVRMAVGATPSRIIWLVVTRASTAALVGALAGGLLIAGLARYVGPLLFLVSPYDLGTYALALLVLIVGSVAAIAIPARNATRVDVRTILSGDNGW